MNNVFEIKSSGEAVSDIDRKQGIITGYLSAFNNVDGDNEIITPGAFKKTLADRGPGSKQPRIKYLMNHDTTKPVGRFTELKEDSHGLKYTAQIGGHAIGQEYLKMVEDGIVTEHSIGFKTIRDEKGTGVRYLHEIKLYEGSGLTFLGSNANTPVLSLKYSAEMAAGRLDTLSKAYRNGTYEDDTFDLIELEIKQLQQFFIDQEVTRAAIAPRPADDERVLTEINNINKIFIKNGRRN